MKNNKGFMMAEVVIVSAIVLSVITVLFVSYNKIYSTYNTRISYYDINTLYDLEYYRNILIENDAMNTAINNLNNTPVIVIYDSSKNDSTDNSFNLPKRELQLAKNDHVLLVKMPKENKYANIEDILNTDENTATRYYVSETFKDYLKYIKTSTDIEANNVMFMERCSTLNNKSKDDCTYAYLEIYDGTETKGEEIHE